MLNGRTRKNGLIYFYWTTMATGIIFTVAVICSGAWNIYKEKSQTLALVKKEALANFNKDQAFRLWGTKHGGVYVPQTESTPSNPYLSHIPDRDLDLPSNKKLTLMNPAYMVRQLMNDFAELYGIRGRITSLNPLNPINEPDEWEIMALKSFESGVDEFFVITGKGDQQVLRLMRPMVTVAGCLKCHAHQGYKEGDIRGGVGVNVSMAPYLRFENESIRAISLSHLVIWLLGAAFLLVVFAKGKTIIMDNMQSEASLRESERNYRTLLGSIQAAVVVHDHNSSIQSVNAMAQKLLGLSEKQLLGKIAIDPAWHFIGEDGTPLTVEEYPVNMVLKRRQPLRDYIAGICRPENTEPVWVIINGDPVFDASGECRQVIVTFMDYTERRKIAEKLKLTQFSVDSIKDCIYWIDEKAKFQFVNNAACRLLGYTQDELLSMGVFDVDPAFPAEEWQTHWRELMEKGSLTIETIHRAKDGHEYQVEVTTNRIEYGKTLLNCAIAREITERKKNEEAMRKINAELEQRVNERTKELQENFAQLQKINKIFVGRELRMAELKKKIVELEKLCKERSENEKSG